MSPNQPKTRLTIRRVKITVSLLLCNSLGFNSVLQPFYFEIERIANNSLYFAVAIMMLFSGIDSLSLFFRNSFDLL